MSRAFHTTLLDRCLWKKHCEQERMRKEALERLLNVLPSLSKKYGIQRAYVFGSILKNGRFHARSDVDVAVKGLSNAKYFRFWAELSDRLGREVDVVQVEKHRLGERVLKGALEWTRES